MNTRDLSTNELQDIAAHERAEIKNLERRKRFLTVKEAHLLKERRAVLRRCRAELKQRIKQMPLF